MKICLIIILVLLTVSAFAANDRPLIFGQNPIGTDSWGYDKKIYDPKEFDLIAASGGAACRTGIGWDQCQKVRGGPFDWTEADRSVNTMIDRGINPVFLFNSTPKWALPTDINKDVPVPVARYACRPEFYPDFEKFIYETTRHFRGRVQFYEFWNEANGCGWHWDKGYGPADEYAPLMIRAYKMIKLADPNARMSTTGVDDNGGGGPDYIRKLYALGCKGYFDAVAEHPYSGKQIDEWKLNNLRKMLDENGDQKVDIWITEMGWTQNGRESTIVEYIKDYFDKLVNNHPTVKIATYHTALDFPGEDYGYGLLDKNLKPKATYEAFKAYPKPARPVASKITVRAFSPTKATVMFTTDMRSKALVMYGLSNLYDMMTPREKTAVTNHKIELVGLLPGNTYHYRIRVEAVDYGDNYSVDYTFTTPLGKAIKIISGPKVTNITDNTATISWITDIAATTQVNFGTDLYYRSMTADPKATKFHSITLKNLSPGTNCFFQVTSFKKGYADAVKEGTPFTTTGGSTPVQPTKAETSTTGVSVKPVEPEPVSIQQAKALPDAEKATITGIVTAGFNEGMTVRTYIQAPDRSAGICISTTASAAPGDTVKATGVMSILNGERVMTLASITITKKDGSIPEPLKVTNRELGGGAVGLQVAVLDDAATNKLATGLNNIGLLVKTSGKVTFIDPSGKYFYINDGSRIKDGSGHVGVRVARVGSAKPKKGSSVTVSGISDIVMVNGKAARYLRPTAANDIKAGK